jgi:hypothetical protein
MEKDEQADFFIEFMELHKSILVSNSEKLKDAIQQAAGVDDWDEIWDEFIENYYCEFLTALREVKGKAGSKKQKKTELVGIKVTPVRKKELTAEAADRDITISGIINLALKQFLGE